MIFENRRQAGEILSKKLSKFKLKANDSVICAIPRGGALVAKQVAQELKIPLKVIVIKKLRAPTNLELAIGAVASFGKPVIDRWLIRDLGVNPDYIKEEVYNKKREARSREKFLGIKLRPQDFEKKQVVVVDDGLATGQTAKMAAKILRQFNAAKLILAIPCGATSVVNEMTKDYDQVVCVEVRDDFMAVGQFYRDFRPVEDEEVKEILNLTNNSLNLT